MFTFFLPDTHVEENVGTSMYCTRASMAQEKTKLNSSYPKYSNDGTKGNFKTCLKHPNRKKNAPKRWIEKRWVRKISTLCCPLKYYRRHAKFCAVESGLYITLQVNYTYNSEETGNGRPHKGTRVNQIQIDKPHMNSNYLADVLNSGASFHRCLRNKWRQKMGNVTTLGRHKHTHTTTFGCYKRPCLDHWNTKITFCRFKRWPLSHANSISLTEVRSSDLRLMSPSTTRDTVSGRLASGVVSIGTPVCDSSPKFSGDMSDSLTIAFAASLVAIRSPKANQRQTIWGSVWLVGNAKCEIIITSVRYLTSRKRMGETRGRAVKSDVVPDKVSRAAKILPVSIGALICEQRAIVSGSIAMSIKTCYGLRRSEYRFRMSDTSHWAISIKNHTVQGICWLEWCSEHTCQNTQAQETFDVQIHCLQRQYLSKSGF